MTTRTTGTTTRTTGTTTRTTGTTTRTTGTTTRTTGATVGATTGEITGEITELSAQALLFDMDGTLVDSTAAVERTWRRFADRHGLDAAAVMSGAHGRRTAETVARHAPAGTDVAAETAWLVAQDVADTGGTVALPGAAGLLAALPADRWALVTSAGAELARQRMAAAGLPLPSVVISAEDVQRGKPDPEGYLRAAALLGVGARDALVLEDAELGLRAARAAGARALVVGPHGGAEATGLPRIADFRGVTVTATYNGIRLALPGPVPARAG
ncbi:HAD-IA family hydrolase [Streptomyces sp. NPDC050418]|uniref:HAD-IA family hydrolase n=1 Tax=Streptomyces sp. NPDC050418 TaxID=3365612 RepID=UPI0037AF91E9